MWARQAWAVLRKDVLIEARSRINLNAMVFFAVIVLLIFSFALGPDPVRLRAAAGGLLWLAFVFAGILAFGRIYQIEMDNNAFEGLMLVAQNRSAVYVGKLLGGILVMLLIEVVVLPLMSVLYNLDLWGSTLPLLGISLLGTIGFAAVGTLYGALTMRLRVREVLLPLLLLPVTVPVILGGVKATNAIIVGPAADAPLWVMLLVVFDIVFVTAGLLTYEYAVTE